MSAACAKSPTAIARAPVSHGESRGSSRTMSRNSAARPCLHATHALAQAGTTPSRAGRARASARVSLRASPPHVFRFRRSRRRTPRTPGWSPITEDLPPVGRAASLARRLAPPLPDLGRRAEPLLGRGTHSARGSECRPPDLSGTHPHGRQLPPSVRAGPFMRPGGFEPPTRGLEVRRPAYNAGLAAYSSQ